jgi:hypothetical protein
MVPYRKAKAKTSDTFAIDPHILDQIVTRPAQFSRKMEAKALILS